MPRLDFVPERDGFHFDNSFGNQILPGTPFTFTTYGLCGGMAMAALDHWRSGVPVPTHVEDQFEPVVRPDLGLVPAVGTQLRAYIYGRLLDSLLTKAMFTRWITFPWIGPQQFHDWAVGSEFNLVRGIIDSGRPAMLGLWTMGGSPATGHQVLAYGYDEGPRRLYIYDPNHHDEESVLTPISPEAGVESRGAKTGSPDPYRGYFWTDVYNWDENPPYQPRYIDLVVTDGLHVDAGQANIGDAIQVTATVTNAGQYPARFRELRMWSRGPDGASLDAVLGGPEAGLTTLDPGQQVTLVRKAAAFGTVPGTYQVGVSYVSEQGYTRQLPARPGATSRASVELHRAIRLVTDRWIAVPEGARTPVQTGIDVQPGDEVALTGEGAIWAGVWLTGENGPEGWVPRIETNPASPMHNTADAYPFALIGRLADEPWFYIGRLFPGAHSAGHNPGGCSCGSTTTPRATAQASSAVTFRSGAEMIANEEFQATYWQVRSAILGRHFAIGGRSRANLISLDNTLRDQLPAAAGGLTAEAGAVLQRWNVGYRMRENPLMWSGKLLAAIAAEHVLGSPQAERMAIAALDSIEALYRFHRMDHFDGYIIRWDPVTSDEWYEPSPDTRFSGAFLVDADEKDYLYCVPHRDPRHVPLRAQATLDRLMTPAQRAEYEANFHDHFDTCRTWECSMDELAGLVGAYAILFELVPTQAVRSRVTSQVARLADYLAEHGYLLVRPEGGLNHRGATGVLPAFEAPCHRVFARITGSSFPARTDFTGAMQQAGYWRLLQLPVDRVAAGVVAAGVLTSPLLASWLAADGTVAAMVSAMLSGALGGAAAVPPSIQAATPMIMSALPRSIGLYAHSDVFDVSEQAEPALAHLLSAIPADLRFRVCTDMSTLLPASAGRNARGFLPYVGLSAVGDADTTIGQEYVRLMRLHRNGPLVPDATDLLDSCFASAVALLLGADESEEQRLVELLTAHHDALPPAQPEGLGLPRDGQLEGVNEGLDYLAGLSLAWLHAKRRADAGNPVSTPGFPAPPAGAWPGVLVPANAVSYLPDVAQALGLPANGTAVDPFAATVPTARPTAAPLALPPVDRHVIVDHVTVPIRDTDGDVATGVVLEPGDEFEVTASGTITAPEFLARPSNADGWYVVDDATFALHSGIDPDGAHKYALLGRLGGYFFIGTHRPRQRFIYRRALPLYLRINNDDHRRGAGQGAFDVEITAWGPARLRGQNLGLSVPGQMPPGTAQHITVAFRNLGSTWDPSAGFRLVPTPGQADPVWSPAEVPLTTPIPPRGIATFGFDVTSPATLGDYRMSWTLMSQDQAVVSTGVAAVVQVVAARCAELRSLIASLPGEIQGLEAQLNSAAPGEKGAIARQLKALRTQLAKARDEAQRRGCPP